MKEILLVYYGSGNYNLSYELPLLLNKAGMSVTLISSKKWPIIKKELFSQLLYAPHDPSSLIEFASSFIERSTKPIDLVIYGSDELVWAHYDSALSPDIKHTLSPVKNPTDQRVLNGKIGVKQFFQENDILTPPAAVAHSIEECQKYALEIGFPLMLKVPRSSGGQGVFKCHHEPDVLKGYIQLGQKTLLLEKFIEGDLLGADPLYIRSKLLGCNYSVMTSFGSPFSPSVERVFKPYPELTKVMEKIGNKLQLSGFFNCSLIHEKTTKQFYFIEMDFRPNKWVNYGRFVDIDWVKALRSHVNNPESSAQPCQPNQECKIRHFPYDFVYSIASKNYRGLLYWVFHKHGLWRYLPYSNPKLAFLGAKFFLKKLINRL